MPSANAVCCRRVSISAMPGTEIWNSPRKEFARVSSLCLGRLNVHFRRLVRIPVSPLPTASQERRIFLFVFSVGFRIRRVLAQIGRVPDTKEEDNIEAILTVYAPDSSPAYFSECRSMFSLLPLLFIGLALSKMYFLFLFFTTTNRIHIVEIGCAYRLALKKRKRKKEGSNKTAFL